jgi:hypothetical protein
MTFALTESRAAWADRHGPGVLAVIVFAVALWAQTNALVGVFYDDGIYVALAKALAEGHGYVSLHLPDQPPAVHYPPLYPFALSLLWRLWPSFPENVALFALFDSAGLGVAAYVLARHAMRLPLPPALRYPALLLGFVAFPILTLVGVRFSEPLFLTLFGGAIAIADRERVGAGSGLAAGMLAGLSALTRSIGIAAVAGVPIVLWIRGNRVAAGLAGAAGLLLALPWMMWTMRHASAVDPLLVANYGTYTQFAEQAGLQGLAAGLDLRALQAFPRLLLPPVPPPAWHALAALLFAVLAVGVARLWRSVPALFATLVPYVGIVVLWPFTPDRFMWILLPWVALLAVTGCHWLWQRARWGRLMVALVGVMLATGFGWAQAVSIAERRFAVTASRSSAPFRYLVAGIETGVPTDAIVATDGEALVHLYTGRKTVPLILFGLSGREFVYADADTTATYLCDTGVTHVATSWLGGEALPLISDLRAMADSTVTPLFTFSDGSGLFRFRCPR